jgi:hypothetical protein
MLKYLSLIFVVFFAVSCGRTTLTVDPYHHNNYYSNQEKDCKDDCKGLKGKARSDCNRRCN